MKTYVIISSCDAFSDCWSPIMYSFDKFWPDCPFPIYIISNYQKIDSKKVNFLTVGKDNLFASNLKYALNELDCDFVIYFQEDYFLTDYVNSEIIQNHIKYCIEFNIDFLKIHTNDFLSKDQFRIGDSDYCYNPVNTRYSINTSIGIWKKNTLETLCIEGYSGWDWERNILLFIKQNDFKINSQIIHSSVKNLKGIKTIYGGAIAKGRWTRNGYKFLIDNGFNSLIQKREIEGIFISKLAEFYNKHPRSILRFPIVILLRTFLKIKINI